ncbi:MAG: cbb3-type cytochrome oxidase assembly protein CcoS [Fluviicola sp.]|nr:cbb3-type cytochrome oxidase assembly protein CcoS [Fluviicola sp.]
MGVIYLMLVVSFIIAIIFLLGFFWATKNGQFDDDYAPSVRILFEDEEIQVKNKKTESNGNRKV